MGIKITHRESGSGRHCLHNWKQITQDLWGLETVAGYKLELREQPYQRTPPGKARISEQEGMEVSKEIEKLVWEKAVCKVTICREQFVSWIFTVSKDMR